MERSASVVSKFLKTLQRTWLGFSLGGRKPVDGAEPLRRFITAKNWINRTTGNVKPVAFVPRETERGTSMYRVLSTREQVLWRLGTIIASGTHAGVLHGQSELRARKAASCGLDFELGRIPSLHVDMIGWPDSKSARLLLAEKLFDGADAPRFIPTPRAFAVER